MHLAVLSRINAGVLNKTDRHIRAFLRKHLNLPHDALNAFFHASIKDGGLGIPSLRTLVPTLRLNRLEAIRKSLSSLAGGGFVLELLHDHIRRSIELAVPGDHSSYWRLKMLSGVDGVGLRESCKTPGQNNWVRGNTMFLSGRDFINSIKLKFNALPCRSRCSRGRTDDRLYRAGCRRAETLAHILQVCPRTFDQRMRRHNAVVSYTARGLEQRGFTVTLEPHYSTSEGVKKPDIIATKDGIAHIIDAQVVADGEPLRRAHERKLDRYAVLEPIIKAVHAVREVRLHSATLTWRGVWSSDAADSLIESKLLSKRDLLVVASRVIIGGLACFNFFNRSTQMSWNR